MNTGLALVHHNSIPGYVPQRNSYIHASGKIYKFVPRSIASIIKTKEKEKHLNIDQQENE